MVNLFSLGEPLTLPIRRRGKRSAARTHGEDPDQRADFAIFAGAQLNKGEGEHAEAQSGGDAEGEGVATKVRNAGNASLKSSQRTPRPRRTSARHQDQRGRRSVGGNRGDQRSAKHGDHKKPAITTLPRPVRAPAATPAALSI